jgi:hypothetical protein
MPVLPNPRHEAFAQALFAGLAGETRVKRAQSTAYLTAYPNCSNGNSAEAAASRLLRRVKPVLERVRELQAEQNKRLEPKLDLSKERVGRRLDMASRKAEHEGNTANIIAAELGIAKVFGLAKPGEQYTLDPSNAESMSDIGRLLLQSVGATTPSQAAINLAVEANNTFIERLEHIAANDAVPSACYQRTSSVNSLILLALWCGMHCWVTIRVTRRKKDRRANCADLFPALCPPKGR